MGVETAAIAAFLAANSGYIAAASMAIGAASAVSSYVAQGEQAKEQTKANAATAANALQARNANLDQINTRALQERDAAGEKIFESRIQALEGAGTVAARAAGTGVQGSTVEALAREYYAKSGRAEEAITRTENNTVSQLKAEQQGVQAQYEGRLGATPAARPPSLWGLGLGIGTAVASGANGYLRGSRPELGTSPTPTTRS